MSRNFMRGLVLACRSHPGRVVILLGLLLLLLLAGARVGRHLWARQHQHAAEAALERQDFAQALAHLNCCLEVWPGDGNVLLGAARAARRAGDLETAERRLAEYEALQGGTEAGAQERALLEAQQGSLGEGEAALKTVARTDVEAAPLVLEALAQGYRNTLRFPEALECVDALLLRQPTHYRALLWRSQLCAGVQHFSEARRDAETAVELAPQSAAARLQLADVLRQTGAVQAAAGQFEIVRRAAADEPEALLGLARCRQELADPGAARHLLEQLLAEHPNNVAALVEGGRLELHTGHPAKAEALLKRAVTQAPLDRDAHRALCDCLEVQGKTAEAELVQAQRQRIEASQGRTARLILRSTLEAPRDVSLRFDIASALVREGRDEQALHWLFATLQLDPGHRPAHQALAEVLERAGQPHRAARHRRLAGAESGAAPGGQP